MRTLSEKMSSASLKTSLFRSDVLPCRVRKLQLRHTLPQRGSEIATMDRQRKAASSSELKSQLPLKGVPEATWSEILCYLECNDLLQVEKTCKFLKNASHQVWKMMDALNPDFAVSSIFNGFDDVTLRERVWKFSMAASLARKLQKEHRDCNDCNHYYHASICEGCSHFCDFDLEPIESPNDYDYFCRIIYENADIPSRELVLWEGFVPLVNHPFPIALQGSPRRINLFNDQQDIPDRQGSMFLDLRRSYRRMRQWHQMESLLQAFNDTIRTGQSIRASLEPHGQLSPNKCELMNGLNVTIVAVSKSKPCKLSLVVAARRFRDTTQACLCRRKFVALYFDEEAAYPHSQSIFFGTEKVTTHILTLLSSHEPSQLAGLGIAFRDYPPRGGQKLSQPTNDNQSSDSDDEWVHSLLQRFG